MGGAGELNHSFLKPESPESGAGERFYHHVESVPVVARYNKTASATVSAKITGIHDLFVLKTPEAEKALADYYRYVALALSHVINLLNPEAIVLGGGISRSIEIGRLKALIDSCVYPAFVGSFALARSRKGDLAGVLGAALLV
ncbi:hypothetical protein COY95_05000 [Candidatus Woesearchaeota archaeon CG_4_10_14_0_8_um_filter_47_5]|nr:MAG: hypothetical protein COY95_05000 [Candidatus Woesearchaeota archaeon CG_4_10_14_0_8_um_filter_47_5]